MEIIDSFFGAQHMVGVGEVKIHIIEVGPPRDIMAIRV